MTYGEPYVWVAPSRQGGEPCVGGTRITTRGISYRVWAGTTLDEVCEHVHEGLDRRSALVALWHEARYSGTPAMRRAWRGWGKEAGAMLWHTKGELPDAPSSTKEIAAGRSDGRGERG